LIGGGAPAVGTDPDPANARAIRAYEKARFVAWREGPGWEGARALLMVRFAS
jgi:RimJ/RimL family protein N-acetyltransferase